MEPIENLPKGSVLLLSIYVTDACLLNYMLQPLILSKVQHGMAVDPDECKVYIYVLKKDRTKALKVLKRMTSIIDYNALSKVHNLLNCNN